MTDSHIIQIPGGIAIIALDDDAPTTSNAYASKLDFVASDGTLLGRIAGDAKHNHLGMYTRLHPVGHSSDKRVKRWNIGGGSVDTQFRLMGGQNKDLPEGEQHGTTRFWIDSEESAILDLDGPLGRVVQYTRDGRYRMTDISPKDDVALWSVPTGPDAGQTRTIDFEGHTLANLTLDDVAFDTDGFVPREDYDQLAARVTELEGIVGRLVETHEAACETFQSNPQ